MPRFRNTQALGVRWPGPQALVPDRARGVAGELTSCIRRSMTTSQRWGMANVKGSKLWQEHKGTENLREKRAKWFRIRSLKPSFWETPDPALLPPHRPYSCLLDVAPSLSSTGQRGASGAPRTNSPKTSRAYPSSPPQQPSSRSPPQRLQHGDPFPPITESRKHCQPALMACGWHVGGPFGTCLAPEAL